MGQTRKRPLAPTGGEGKGEGGRSRGPASGLRRRQTDTERVLWRQWRDRQLQHAKFCRQAHISWMSVVQHTGSWARSMAARTNSSPPMSDGRHSSCSAAIGCSGSGITTCWAIVRRCCRRLSTPCRTLTPALSLSEGEGKDKATHTMSGRAIRGIVISRSDDGVVGFTVERGSRVLSELPESYRTIEKSNPWSVACTWLRKALAYAPSIRR